MDNIANIQPLINKASRLLLSYGKKYYNITSEEELAKIVKPTTVLIKSSGDIILLLNSKDEEDYEHGLGIKLN